jgi:hypothetical protein
METYVKKVLEVTDELMKDTQEIMNSKIMNSKIMSSKIMNSNTDVAGVVDEHTKIYFSRMASNYANISKLGLVIVDIIKQLANPDDFEIAGLLRSATSEATHIGYYSEAGTIYNDETIATIAYTYALFGDNIDEILARHSS